MPLRSWRPAALRSLEHIYSLFQGCNLPFCLLFAGCV